MANGYERNALLVSKSPFDATNVTGVDGFTITGEQPVGTARRLAFKLDDKIYRFNGTSLAEIAGDLNVGNILSNGNIPEDLVTLTDIPEFVGKKIFPIIALHADDDITLSPTVKIGLKLHSGSATYQKPVISPEYELAYDGDSVPRIADIICHTTCTGDATANASVRLKYADGTWSNFIPLAAAAQQEATHVQFKLDYNVTRLDGVDSAKIDSITIRHNLGATAVSGNVAELYSVVQNYDESLQTCYIVVRHAPLRDAEIRAYVNFMSPPKKRELIFIGEGDGTLKQYSLGVDGVKDTGIDQNTLHIYIDGEEISDFGYNVEVSEVTINAPVGAAVTASYEYGHDDENWLEMSRPMNPQPYMDDLDELTGEPRTYMSRFSYTLPDDAAVDTSTSNVRISLYRASGSVTNESLGKASGLVQQIVLPHAARQDTIQLNADWSYNNDTRVLTFVADRDKDLLLTYDYLGEQQIIYSWAVGWAVAI